MKRTVCLVSALILTLSLTACIGGDDQKAAPKGDPCPATTLTEIDQNGYTDRTFDPTALEKITVINFWAYWCPPCVNELPHFDRVAREMADEVTIVAVHCDTVEKAQAFIAENYPDSPIRFAMDAQNDAFAYYSALGGGGSIPYTVIVDADGYLRQTFTGAITYDALVAAVESCR